MTYTVTYADANFSSSSLALGNITLDPTGTASGTVAVSGSGLTYTVTVSNITGDGSLGISIAAGTATDKAGNAAPAATSATFIVDNTAPTISIGAPSASYVAGGPVTYTVTYADANFSSSSLALSNITLDPTGTANGTLAVSGSGLTYTVTVSNITGDGSLGISIAAGTATDKAGNAAPAATSATFIVDNTAPTISIGAPSASYAAGGPVTYTVTYADANFSSSSLALSNITLDPTGTANGTLAVTGSGLTYTVTVSNITGNGSLGISIAAGTATDKAGNTAPAATSATFIADNIGPTVASPAIATPDTVTGTSTILSVLGADIATGEGTLTYSWSTTSAPNGAAIPTFSDNGDNAAKNTTATFYAAGNYSFQVKITAAGGLSATSSVDIVTVNQTLMSISNTGLPLALDQFGNPLANQPISDGNTITDSLAFDSNVTVLPAAGSQLTISGGISGQGGLTVNAPGTLVLSGANGYTGGTTVSTGTLVLGNSSAIAAGTGLTVGAGGVFVFDPSSAVTPALAAAVTTPRLASSASTIAASSVASVSISSVTRATAAAPVCSTQSRRAWHRRRQPTSISPAIARPGASAAAERLACGLAGSTKGGCRRVERARRRSVCPFAHYQADRGGSGLAGADGQ